MHQRKVVKLDEAPILSEAAIKATEKKKRKVNRGLGRGREIEGDHQGEAQGYKGVQNLYGF